MFDNGEAQSRAAGFARTPAVHSIKAFRKSWNVFGLNSYAAILYRKYASIIANLPVQVIASFSGRIPYGITDKVAESAA